MYCETLLPGAGSPAPGKPPGMFTVVGMFRFCPVPASNSLKSPCFIRAVGTVVNRVPESTFWYWYS